MTQELHVRQPDLLLVGASARAAAFSAVRAGLMVAAADLFADIDLVSVASVTVIKHWPQDVECWASTFPRSVPLIYIGGLENHLDLLGRIACQRPVAGVVGESLRLVRTPELLRSLLTGHGVPVAPLGTFDELKGSRWLVKPRRSGGGRGIRFLRKLSEPIADEEYVQGFVEGRPGSAAFLATVSGNLELVGTCESLTTQPTANTEQPFAYRGSITCDDFPIDAIHRIGVVLQSSGLRGLFGVDFVQTERGECVVVEVNPRYTASMELFELQSGRSLIAEQLNGFCVLPAGNDLMRGPADVGMGRIIGKRIVYTPFGVKADIGPSTLIGDILRGSYAVADIPGPDSMIPASSPLCTVFARAKSKEACCKELDRCEALILQQCVPA